LTDIQHEFNKNSTRKFHKSSRKKSVAKNSINNQHNITKKFKNNSIKIQQKFNKNSTQKETNNQKRLNKSPKKK